MKTKISILFCLLASIVGLHAQNAKNILDNANKAYNDAGIITASFTINTEDSKNKLNYSQDGKAFLKGNKFKIDVPDGTTWFDGTTQWVYVKGSDEVNVSNPTGEELASVSPAIILNIYKTGFKLNYRGEKIIKGKPVYIVELIPLNKKSEFSKIYVNIDKATNLFTSIRMYDKNGFNNELIINKIQTKTNLAENIFVFNKKEFPKAEIVDLR